MTLQNIYTLVVYKKTWALEAQSIMINFDVTQRILPLILFSLMSVFGLNSQSLIISCPEDIILDVSTLTNLSQGVTTQDLVDAAFDDWLVSFTFDDNGCNPVETGKVGLRIPSANFGGTTIINYSVSDNCTNTESCAGSFSLSGTIASPIIVSCPPDIQMDNTATQFQVDSAFNIWVNSFTSFPTTTLATDLTTLVPPALGGNPVQVTYIAEDPTNPANVGTCESTFIPPSSSLTTGNDEIPTLGQWGIISLTLLLLILSINGLRESSSLAR